MNLLTKKTIAYAVIFALFIAFFTMIFSQKSSADYHSARADINRDSVIDINDSLYLLKNILNPKAYPVEYWGLSDVESMEIDDAGNVIIHTFDGMVLNLGRTSGLRVDENGRIYAANGEGEETRIDMPTPTPTQRPTARPTPTPTPRPTTYVSDSEGSGRVIHFPPVPLHT